MSKFSVDAVFNGVDHVSRTMRSISARMRALGDDKAFKTLNDQADEFVGGLRTVALTAVAATTALAGLGANVVATGMEFEATLMGAVARFPGEIRRGTEAFNELQGAAERLGATTEFDAQQAASALQAYAASGFNAELAISSLAGAGNLATVSGLALDEAAKTAADSLGALGLRVEDAGQQAVNLTRLNDRLARATGLANTSVTELAEGIKVGGNMTVQSGQSFETFTALMASMAGANIKGAEAGTAIRNMFSSLQAPSKRASDVLRRLHIRVADGNGNMRDMVDIVGDLARATSSMGDRDRNAALNHLFGDAAMPAALALMNTGAAGLQRFRTELLASDGAAARMAGTMRDTTKNEIDGFTSAIDGVKTALFGVISGPMRQILGQLTQWIGSNTQLIAGGAREWMERFAANLDTIKRRAQGLAVLITGLGAIALGIKAVAAATAIWNALAAANPWMLAIMAIVVAVAALVAYRAEVEAFFRRFTIIGNIVGFVGRLAVGLGAVILAIKGAAIATAAWNAVLAINPAVAILMGIIAAIIAIDYYWPQIEAHFESLADDASYLGDEMGRAFGTNLSQIESDFDRFSGNISGYFSSFGADARYLGSEIARVFNASLAQVQSDFERVWSAISGAAARAWSTIASSFSSVVGPVIDTALRIVNAITGSNLSFGGAGGETGAPAQPQVVSPQQRTAQAVNSTSTNTTTAEVRVRAEPGTSANVTRQPARGTPVRVTRSAA